MEGHQHAVVVEDLAQLGKVIDTGWTLIATSLIFIMQGGFMMLEIGAVREKNAKSSLVKKILQIGISTTAWWAIGFPLAYCAEPWDPSHYSRVFSDSAVDWTFVILNWAFCATSTTIISGCIAERTTLRAYLVLTLLMCTIVYPVVVRAVWSKHAILRNVEWAPWLQFEDWAGGAVVHLLGGVAGAVFAWRVGPRVGMFRNKEKERLVYRIEPHSVFLMGGGTIIIWFGWYGLCAGSTKGLTGGGALVASRVFMTTSLSPAAASLSVALAKWLRKSQSMEPSTLCNGVLAGLVSITAPCACVDAWAAIVIGFIGGLVFLGARRFLMKLGIDDPLGAFAVHGACGAWGTLSIGIFGASWSHHPASFKQLLSQIVGVTAITTWTVALVLFVLLVLERIIPLRVTLEQELRGLDDELFRGTRGGSEISSPEGRVAIVVTDVQGSTSLWASDQRAMADAITIHDDIMRLELGNYGGYEIGTEGDAFQVAFSTTTDALGFCISVQQRMLEANWPARLLAHPDAEVVSFNDGHIFNGLRVRMGVDVGICKRVVHQTSRTFRYVGGAMDTAKTIVDCLPSGGIIAVTHRTLEEMGPKIAKMGGLLSVCDLGTHLLKASSSPVAVFAVTHQDLTLRIPLMKALETHNMARMGFLHAPAVKNMHELIEQKINEEQPQVGRRVSSIAQGFSFRAARLKKLECRPLDEVVICFASLLDLQAVAKEGVTLLESDRLTQSHGLSEKDNAFDQHPHPTFERKISVKSSVSQHYREWTEGQRSAEQGDMNSEASLLREAMASCGRIARTALWQLNGYECKEDKYIFMTAFSSATQAVQWATTVAAKINEDYDGTVSFACGMHVGLPTEVKPNQATGRADYYGTLVNTAARIHSLARKAAEKSSIVYVSQSVRDRQEDTIERGIEYTHNGSHLLKGLKLPTEIYLVAAHAFNDDIFEMQECVIPTSPTNPSMGNRTRSFYSGEETEDDAPVQQDFFLWGATDSAWDMSIVHDQI